MIDRLPIVGVMGSGSNEHAAYAEPLGRWLAESGCHVLTGGGAGVMTAVSRAFVRVQVRTGVSIGILPSASADHPESPPYGYPNPYIEVPIRTHLHLSGERGTDPRSRNPINVLSAAVIVALPGGAGTASEVRLAVQYAKPVIVFGPDTECIPGLPDSVQWTDDLEVVQNFVKRHT